MAALSQSTWRKYVRLPGPVLAAAVAGCLALGALGAALGFVAWAALGLWLPTCVSAVAWLARRRGYVTWPYFEPRRGPFLLATLPCLAALVVGWVLLARHPFAWRLWTTVLLTWATVVAPQVFPER